MALQLRTTLPDGVPGAVYQRAIADKLTQAAEAILGGISADKYVEWQSRYAVLHELLRVAEEYVDEQAKGETIATE